MSSFLVLALREQMANTASNMSNQAYIAANTINNQTMQAISSMNNTMNNQKEHANNAIYTIRSKSGDIPLNGPIGSIVGLGICKCHTKCVARMWAYDLMHVLIVAAKKASSVCKERKDKKDKEKATSRRSSS